MFTELYWVPALLEQAEARCHRIGSKGTVYVWYLIGHHTIDEHIYEVIKRKTEVIQKALGDEVGKDDPETVKEIIKRYISKVY